MERSSMRTVEAKRIPQSVSLNPANVLSLGVVFRKDGDMLTNGHTN